MHILVTGVSGFIGQRLAAELGRKGHRVTGVVRQPAKAIDGLDDAVVADLAIPGWTRSLPEAGVDAVMHLAQSRNYRDFPEDAADATQINVAASVELARWAALLGVRRFLFVSSGTVYPPENRVHAETDACAPSSFYGLTKLAAELLLDPFARQMQLQIVRLFAAYGPGQTNAMIPNVIDRFSRGEAIHLAQNIGVRINPIFIEDCVSILSRLIETDMQQDSGLELLNLGGTETIDLRLIADILSNAAGRTAKVEVTNAEPVYLVGSTSRLQTRLALPPMTSFDEGLRRTTAWLSNSNGG